MKKIIVLLVLSMFLIVACSAKKTENSSASVPVPQQAIETKEPAQAYCPGNTCEKDGCIDNYLYECKTSNNGCKFLERKGMFVGKCGVECFKDEDCNFDQDCYDGSSNAKAFYKCINVTADEATYRKSRMDAGLSFR